MMTNASQNQAQSLYKVGDYVYFETSANQPYQIRRIEELQKLPNNQVEAKVTCFFRRRDLSSQLLQLADKHNSVVDGAKSPPGPKASEAPDEQVSGVSNTGTSETNGEEHILSPKQRHQLKHRELFMSRQVETLSATLIRGKCSVTLLNEVEQPSAYVQRSDAFYYRLVYDPDAKTLLADRGEIRVGPKYQVSLPYFGELQLSAAKVPGSTSEEQKASESADASEIIESPLWVADRIDDRQLEQFVTIMRSVGAYARALDVHSAAKHSSLQLSAAAASRDVTSQAAYSILHEADYKVDAALSRLLPVGGPLLCRDEMEGWTAHEAQLFEIALEKCGKDFAFIRTSYLPWKSTRNVIEYYYFWKTTDRYVQQRRSKALEASRKLTTFYVAPFNKPSPALLTANHPLNITNAKPCESCCAQSAPQWYAFGPAQQTRICSSCWSYWKRYGGLKLPTRLDGERPTPRGRQERLAETVLANSTTAPSRPIKQRSATDESPGPNRSSGSSRSSFSMQVTPLGRLARLVCNSSVHSSKLARAPTRTALSTATVKLALTAALDALPTPERSRLIDAARDRERGRLARAELAVREMMRLHPYFRACPADDSATLSISANLDSATKRCTRSPVKCASNETNGHGNLSESNGNHSSSIAPAITISRRTASKLSAHASSTDGASLDSATKRCTKSSPVKCALGSNGDEPTTPTHPPSTGIGRRSAYKLNATTKHCAANGDDDDRNARKNGDGDRLRVGLSATGITRKRLRDLASPEPHETGTQLASLDSEHDAPAKRWRGEAQLLVNKSERGVSLRVVAPASGIDASGAKVFEKYRECVQLVNDNERVAWEPSWYMRIMPVVRRVRSKCTKTCSLRRLGRKWTQATFELPADCKPCEEPQTGAKREQEMLCD